MRVGTAALDVTPDAPIGPVAQLGERLVCIQEVVGSNPVGSTICQDRQIGPSEGRPEVVSAKDGANHQTSPEEE